MAGRACLARRPGSASSVPACVGSDRAAGESSEELLAWLRYFRGDRSALGDLAERFRRLLVERIRRRVFDRSRSPDFIPVDPEDILQRMLLDLWRRRLPVRVQKVGAYVSGIIDKAVVSECRRLRGSRNAPPRAQSLDAFDEQASATRPASDGSEQIDAADQWAQLTRRLSHAERVLLQMVRAGLGWQAIGERLAIRPQAARMRFHRVVTRLRRCHAGAVRTDRGPAADAAAKAEAEAEAEAATAATAANSNRSRAQRLRVRPDRWRGVGS